MKRTILFMAIIVLMGASSIVYANSVDYKLSVTIPAIAGLNVPYPSMDVETSGIKRSDDFQAVIQQAFRQGEPVIIKTAVVR